MKVFFVIRIQLAFIMVELTLRIFNLDTSDLDILNLSTSNLIIFKEAMEDLIFICLSKEASNFIKKVVFMVDSTIIDMNHFYKNLLINIILMDFIRNTDMAVKTMALHMVVSMVPDKYFGVEHMEHQMDFVVVSIDIIQEAFMGVLSYIKVLYKAEDHFRNMDLVID